MKKIKLLIDVPVDRKHNMIQGSIHEVVKEDPPVHKKRDESGYWVAGNGENVKIFRHECEVISS